MLDENTERDRIRRAVKSITASTGQSPAGWYCRYGPSINTRRLLVEHGGFLYDSDSYNDELPYWTRVAGRRADIARHWLSTHPPTILKYRQTTTGQRGAR